MGNRTANLIKTENDKIHPVNAVLTRSQTRRMEEEKHAENSLPMGQNNRFRLSKGKLKQSNEEEKDSEQKLNKESDQSPSSAFHPPPPHPRYKQRNHH